MVSASASASASAKAKARWLGGGAGRRAGDEGSSARPCGGSQEGSALCGSQRAGARPSASQREVPPPAPKRSRRRSKLPEKRAGWGVGRVVGPEMRGAQHGQVGAVRREVHCAAVSEQGRGPARRNGRSPPPTGCSVRVAADTLRVKKPGGGGRFRSSK